MSDVTLPDADGNFVLADGSLGNPGCDECGSADATVRIDGVYLCSHKAAKSAAEPALVQTVQVVLSIDVLVNKGDDDAKTLLGTVLGQKAEVLVRGFGFDARIVRLVDSPALDTAEIVDHNTDDTPAVCIMADGQTIHVFGVVNVHTGEDADTYLQEEADDEAERIALAIENGDAT